MEGEKIEQASEAQGSSQVEVEYAGGGPGRKMQKRTRTVSQRQWGGRTTGRGKEVRREWEDLAGQKRREQTEAAKTGLVTPEGSGVKLRGQVHGRKHEEKEAPRSRGQRWKPKTRPRMRTVQVRSDAGETASK